MPQEDIIKTFENVGIPRTETVVYLDLLQNGASTATVIARRTKMHRANVYDTLSKLKEKNLIYNKEDEGKKTFVALSCDLLLQEEKEKLESLKNAISYLQSNYMKKEVPKVYVLEGLDALKHLLFSAIEQKETIWMYGLAEKNDVTNLLRERFIEMFHIQRIKKQVKLKCLFYNYPIEEVRELNKMSYTEGRILPEGSEPKSSQMSQITCKDKLYVTFWTHPLYTIVIENEAIAKEYTHFFSVLWNASQPVS